MKTRLILVLAPLLALDAFSAPPVYDVERKNDIEFAQPDGVSLLLDLYLPKVEKSPPLILFIHGGGWKNGDRTRCRLAWVAKHGYAIASIEYRLSQEARFPAQIHDCKGALRWLRAHSDEYGYNAERVVVAGTSAGGHLPRSWAQAATSPSWREAPAETRSKARGSKASSTTMARATSCGGQNRTLCQDRNIERQRLPIARRGR